MAQIVVDQGLFGQATPSSSSLTVEGGVKTIELDYDDGTIEKDFTVQILSNTDPDCYMYGVVSNKSGTTLTVSIFRYSSIGNTDDDWSVQVIAGPFAGLPASQTLGFVSTTASVPSVGDTLSWTTDTGKTFYDNSTVYVSSVTDPTAFFFANVTSYDSGTGAIKLVVTRVGGSGSQSLWTISLIDVTASLRTTVGNADYTILPSDRLIALTAALSAPRTWTLPPANSVSPGHLLTISDEKGGLDEFLYIDLVTPGDDTINTSTDAFRVQTPHGRLLLTSDGISNWAVDNVGIGVFDELNLAGALLVTKDASLLADLEVAGTTTLAGITAGDVTAEDITADSLTTTGAVSGDTLKQSGSSFPLGYYGTGNSVSQTVNNNSDVTIHRPSGRITMQSPIAANTTHRFTVNNSTVGPADVVILSLFNTPNAAALNQTDMLVYGIGSGSFNIKIRNASATDMTVAPAIQFCVIHGSVS